MTKKKQYIAQIIALLTVLALLAIAIAPAIRLMG